MTGDSAGGRRTGTPSSGHWLDCRQVSVPPIRRSGAGSGLDPSGPHNGGEIVEHAVKDEFASEHHARTAASAIQPAAQNGTSGVLAGREFQ
jgi:hypothetical protein